MNACFVFFSGCSTTASVALKVSPKDGEVVLFGSRNSSSDKKVVGKGEVSLQGDQVANKLYGVKMPGYEQVLIFFPKEQDGGVLDIALPPESSETRDKLAKLEAEVANLRQTLVAEQEQKQKFLSQIHSVGSSVAGAQRYLTLNMLPEAERNINELFKLPPELLPASAYTLRGKLRLTQGRRSDAVADFEKALSLNSGDIEARAFLGTAKQ